MYFFEISLTNSEALSIQVNVLNSTCGPLTLTWHDSSKPKILKIMFPVRGVNIDGDFFPYQSDTEAWDDDDVGSTSHVTLFSPGCLITWWNHLIVWTTIDLQCNLSNWVEQDFSYNRWCHQHHRLVVSWPSCLNYLLVEEAVFCSAAAIYYCVHNPMDSHSDVECQVSWDNTQCIPRRSHCKDQSSLDPRITLHLLHQ